VYLKLQAETKLQHFGLCASKV